jgi:hypothetical protein
MGDNRNSYRGLVGKPEGKSHLEDLGLDERIILKGALKKLNVRVSIALISTGTSGGLL